MAAPHIAGIAALIKQYNPFWTPSMIASAISTTATKYDSKGELIMAEGYNIGNLYPSTPFDLGAGLVSPTHAMDPGLVLFSGKIVVIYYYMLNHHLSQKLKFIKKKKKKKFEFNHLRKSFP
jgi:hypothetical protein